LKSRRCLLTCLLRHFFLVLQKLVLLLLYFDTVCSHFVVPVLHEAAIPGVYFILPVWQIVFTYAWPSSSAAEPGVNDILRFLIQGSQLQPTGTPLNLLRTCLRVALVYTHNERGWGIDFTARHYILTHSMQQSHS